MLQQNIPEMTRFGVGSYTIQEAASLIKESNRNIARWMKGYSYTRNNEKHHIDPLWETEWPSEEDHIELGFRDLIELRFVKAFTDAGIGLLAIRNCLEYARECVNDDHPFSTRRFQTDGKTIFLEGIQRSKEARVLDLKRRQYVFRQIIAQTFKDLDIEDDAVARWRPFNGKQTIVIDPKRSFGQPITNRYGIPTVVLSDALAAEGSIDRVSRLYDVPPNVIKDAVKFESTLKAA